MVFTLLTACSHPLGHDWQYWGIVPDGEKRRWWCNVCGSIEFTYWSCQRCRSFCCTECIKYELAPRLKECQQEQSTDLVLLKSSLSISNYCIKLGVEDWCRKARQQFSDSGFVIVSGMLDSSECQAVLKDCKKAAQEIVGSQRAGNRGPGRYSFGVASSTGAMLHVEAFSDHLLNSACSKLYPLLEKVFEGGTEHGFICTGGGGDFVLGGTDTDQHIHSDIQVQKSLDVWMPPPMISVNFVLEDLTHMNGATRMIPGTQLWRGEVPHPIPARWERSCLCPLPAGTAIIRDVRTLHSGTRNMIQATRYLPSIEFVSADCRSTGRQDWFTPIKSLPNKLYQRLSPEMQKVCEEIAASKDQHFLNPTYWKS